MKKYSAIILVLIGVYVTAYNQTHTNLYNNDFEQNLFKNLAAGTEVAPADLFFAINYNENTSVFRSLLETHLKDLEEQLAKKDKVEQKLKIIDKKTAKAFLKKYDQAANFSDLFVSKKYNSITGAAIYTIILDKFGINYTITDNPERVEIVADPGNTDYTFESIFPAKTIPQYNSVMGRNLYISETEVTDNNNMQYNEPYQQYFVEFLCNIQIISEDECKTGDTGSLFKKYYTLAESITLENLAGLQYFNAGIYKFNSASYHEALACFKKSLMLYPNSYNITNLLNITLTQVLENEMENKSFNPELMQLYFSINLKDTAAVSKGKAYFENLSRYFLANENDTDGYNAYCNALFSMNLDDEIERELQEIRYNLLAKYYSSKGIEFKALQMLVKSFELNPENKELNKLRSDLAANLVLKQQDSEIMLDTIEKYTSLFPFLNKDSRMGDIRIQCLAEMISTSFEKDDFESGLGYIDELESYVKDYPGIKFDPYNVEDAFIKASIKYVQNGNYKKAYDILSRGLLLVPESSELKRRHKNLQGYIK